MIRVFASISTLMLFCVSQAFAMDELPPVYYLGAELDYGSAEGASMMTWDVEAYRANDESRLILEAEGETYEDEVEASEVQLLYGRTISDFWNLQLGVRRDLAEYEETFAVVGVEGMTPFFLETELQAFIPASGGLELRLEQHAELRITQAIVAKPYYELDFSFHDSPRRGIREGLSKSEIGLQVRYEINRKLAPYVDFVYERAHDLVEENLVRVHEDEDKFSTRIGVKFWF